MMDDLLLNSLGKALYSLERCGPGLDDLLVPRQASSGENAGKAPARKGSKVPLSTTILDLKVEAENVLARWCGLLRQWEQIEGPAPVREIGTMAAWLQTHLLELELMPWASIAAEQLIAESRMVSDVVDPPVSASDPEPVWIGSVPVVTSWAQNLGCTVATRTVYQWVATEQVPSMAAPNGRIIVRLADVMERARMTGQSILR